MLKEIINGSIVAVIEALITLVFSHFWNNLLLIFVILFLIINIVFLIFLYIPLRKKTKNLLSVGIIDCTEQLKATSFEPQKCMRNVQKSLFFMGVGGAKWVEEEVDLVIFKQMINKVSAEHGKVEFLLLNPFSSGYDDLKKLRNDAVPTKSYKIFLELVKNHETLRVHLYDNLPSFRMQFMDDKYAAISRYYFSRELYDNTGQGWNIPHLIVQAEKTNSDGSSQESMGSLYNSFRALYDYVWNRSKNILELEDEIKKL